MYRCDVCDEVTRPGDEEFLIPDGFRVRRYRPRRNANLTAVSWKKKPVLRDDPGGVGYEWRGELQVCRSCHDEYVEEQKGEQLARVEARIEERAESYAAK